MNGKNYSDGEISMETFYKKLREGAVSKTAQIAPSTYEEIFEKEILAGNDVLYLGFSSGLSGSFNSSCIARDNLLEKYPDAKIICVDSLCASTGEGLLLYKADEKKKNGMDIDNLAKWLEATKLHLCHVFTVDDLKFLRRGGRVSATAAFAGTLLGIKPVLHVDNEGHLIPLGKVRGRKHSLEKLVDMMQERVSGWENPTVMICHGDTREDAEYVEKLVKERFGKQTDVKICYTGTVIGSHSGPGTLALFFMGEER
jgi:DegV family protein with EDD domain